MDIRPTFEHDVSVIPPKAGTSVVGSEVGEEVLKSSSKSNELFLDWLEWVGMLSAVSANNEQVIALAINPGDISFIKVIECSPNI